jgi:hypothetical protein
MSRVSSTLGSRNLYEEVRQHRVDGTCEKRFFSTEWLELEVI